MGYGDLDRFASGRLHPQTLGAQRGAPGQDRPGMTQQGRPFALTTRRRSRVVEQDAVVQAHPLAATELPRDQRAVTAHLEHLPVGDHATLPAQQSVDLGMAHTADPDPIRTPTQPMSAWLWTSPSGHRVWRVPGPMSAWLWTSPSGRRVWRVPGPKWHAHGRSTGVLRTRMSCRAHSRRRDPGKVRLMSVRPSEPRPYSAFAAASSLVRESLASPKSSVVLGSKSSSFSMPAKPGRIDRLRKTTCWAWSTSRIGMP